MHGNERVDEVAGIVGVLKTLSPEPPRPILKSVFKWYTKEWATFKPEERSGTTQKMVRKPNC